MVPVARSSFLPLVLGLSVLRQVLARRTMARSVDALVQSEPEGDAARRLSSIFVESSDSICGSEQIKKLLTASPSVDSVRNTPWSKIMAIADAHLATQNVSIERLTLEVGRLEADVKRKAGEEAKADVPEEQLRAAVAAGLAGPGAFGGVEGAVASLCGGAPRAVCRKLKPPVRASAFKKSQAAFGEEAAKLFTGAVRTNGAAFRKVCDSMLPLESSDEGSMSYCGELCQSFSDAAQQLSDSTAGETAGTAADELRRLLQEKREARKAAVLEYEGCENAKDLLHSFQLQLGGLQADIKVQLEKVQDAREALGEAEELVMDLEEELDEKEDLMTKALELVETTGTKAQAAKAALQSVNATETDLKAKVQQCKADLEAAKGELEKANEADAAVQQLKSLVSQTMLNMAVYFNDAVLVPVRQIGLGADTHVDDYFYEAPGKLQAAADFKTAVGSLADYCETTAKPAFAKVSKSVPGLAGLCEFGPVEDVATGVQAAVKQRMGHLVEELKSVQSWLNPYKGQRKMSQEEAERLVLAGEPSGLREVMGTFGQTPYYKGYLKLWKKNARDGFLALYDDLGATLAKLEEKYKQISQQLSSLIALLEEAGRKREVATKELGDAVANNEVAVGQKDQAAAILAAQQEETSKAIDRMKALRDAVDAALKKYQAARALLVETHRKGTSMLQFEAEQEALAEDAADSDQPDMQLSGGIRKAL